MCIRDRYQVALARRLKQEKLIRQARLKVQTQKKKVEKAERRAAELEERIAAREARALVRNRGREQQVDATMKKPAAFASNGSIRWPEMLSSPSFARNVRDINKLVGADANPSELKPALKNLRTIIGKNARTLGTKKYIVAKQFVEQLARESNAPAWMVGKI